MIIQNIKSPEKTKTVSDLQWKKLPPSIKSQWKVLQGAVAAEKPEELKAFAPSAQPIITPPAAEEKKPRGRRKKVEVA